MKQCDKGYHGMCCCTCTNQLVLYKHPWNKQYKGSIGEETGLYACAVFHAIDKNKKAVIREIEHGCCENWHGEE